MIRFTTAMTSLSAIFHCCNQILEKRNVKKDRLVSAHSLRTWSMSVRGAVTVAVTLAVVAMAWQQVIFHQQAGSRER